MSRDAYGAPNLSSGGPGGGGSRSPRGAGSRRLAGELPTVDCSPSRQFPGSGRRGPRSGTASPVLDHGGGYQGGYGPTGPGGGGYYRDEDLGSPIMMDERGRGMGSGGHHRSRSASRPVMSGGGGGSARYQSLDRTAAEAHDRDFVPIRDRERSLERGLRDRSLDRGMYEDDLYRPGARASPLPRGADSNTYISDLQQQNTELQRELANFKKELELTNQKLGSSMHSIKTFWSPELKKERALRKEESAKYSLINDQLKLLNSENQKQAMLVRQLEEELRLRSRNPSAELQQQVELLYAENEHLTREIAILRETIKELELRIETQKQTLAARDESIKKLLEMLQNKGVGGKMLDEERVAIQTLQARLIESEDKVRHYEILVRHREQELCKTERDLKATNETLKALQMQLEKAFRTQNSSGVASNSTLTAILETKDARIATLEKEVALLELELDRIREYGAEAGGDAGFGADGPAPGVSAHAAAFAAAGGKRQLEEFRAEVQRRDQEILAMSAKMKTLEEQHTDYQRHIAVLKESLCAKEEHYNMLQADVEELRQRLEEKNRHIEKKTLQTTQATQERNRLSNEINELRDHMDIKDRKINVLQRKFDLQEANKKAAADGARRAAEAGEEASALKRQVEEQKRQLEEQRRRLEEAARGADGRSRQLEERERALADAETRLKRRKEGLDQKEAQLQKVGAGGGGGDAGSAAVQQRLQEVEKEMEKARADAQHAQEETERLLRLVQMSQEEQNQKEKTIRDLQEALKNAQTKLRSQQAANAQMREEGKQQQQRRRGALAEGGGDGGARRRDGSDGGSDGGDDEDSGSSDGSRSSPSSAGSAAERDKELKALRREVEERRSRAQALEAEVAALEAALRDHSGLEELEELVGVVRLKDERIAELEEALRESVRITADRERALHHEEGRRRQVVEKVGKLEQRLLSLQRAHALRCSSCRPLLARAQDLEQRLARLLAERSGHLRELAAMKQEALEAAISEKDAHLALLEVSGLRTARQAEQADRLRADRRRLMDRLKRETEQSVKLLQQYEVPELSHSPAHNSLRDEDDDEEEDDEDDDDEGDYSGGARSIDGGGGRGSRPPSAPSTPRHNGHPLQTSEVEPDSLDAASSSETTPSM